MKVLLVSPFRCFVVLLGLVLLIIGQGSCSHQSSAFLSGKNSQNLLTQSPMKDDLIQLKIIAEPLKLTIAERKNFKISLAATNKGNEVMDPELHLVQLFINGEESTVWSLAIGNGRREEKWFALPPNDTVSLTWSTLGVSLFPEPGKYALVFRFGDTELEPINVEVLSENIR